MRDKVEQVFKEIQDILRADGSDIELLRVTDDGVVQFRFKGTCGSCGGSMPALRRGVERMLMERVPEVKSVVET